MKQVAIVESINGNIAKIKVKRESACSGCKSETLCASCMKTVTADAVNDIGANIGDTVSIESESKTILLYAVCTFIIPIVCALSANLITAYFFASELISNLSMLGGFIIPLIILILVFRNKKNVDIIITEIINDNNYKAETGVQNDEQ